MESESKTKCLSLASKNQDAAANSDDDFEQSKVKKRRFAVSLPEEVEVLKTSGSEEHKQIDDVGSTYILLVVGRTQQTLRREVLT